MSNPTLRFYFKLVYTTKTWELDIDSSMKIIDFIEYVNKNSGLRPLFNIHEQYYIEIVKADTNINGDSEMGPAIENTNITIGEKFNPRFDAFYIRPVISSTREFIRSNDYSIMSNNQQQSGVPESQTLEPAPRLAD
jgi:hypothetical protein